LVAWRIFEGFVPHKIRRLGVSNFSLPQLQKLYNDSTIKPVIVQNRFYRDTSFDIDIRAFCQEHGITYQAFWMLRHNPEILTSELLQSVAEKLAVEKEIAFYILLLSLGDVEVLDGTSRAENMEKDVKAVATIFGSKDKVEDLRPSVEKFKKLCEELSRNSAQTQVA
jgi:diketogulonate reductase-like aldo/keto reductase